MTVYYARGGGFGHVTRARRVLAALGLEGEIVTQSDRVFELFGASASSRPVRRLPGGDDSRRQDAGDPADWKPALPNRLIVDAFPGGLDGELCGVDVPMDYVARLLRWNPYRRAVPGELPRFGTTWIVEELTPEHRAFVDAHSDRVEFLDLSIEAARDVPVEDYWVVVHSGPEHEVRELVAYAAELDPRARIVVASPYPVEGYEHVDAYPASHLFPAAARIVSAAGFNVMLETEAWRDKHLVVPFPRKFDDQFLRAARRRATASSPRPTRPRRTDTTGAGH